MKNRLLSCLVLGISVLPGIGRADSPLTSTPFSDAYLDVPIIREAKQAGVMNERFADYLSSPMVPIDRKAALVNALSWRFEGKHNAVIYSDYLTARYPRMARKLPTPDEMLCLGYLAELDDYFNPRKALPLLEFAREGNTRSFTIAIICALCQAQVALESDWAEVWRATRRVELNRRLVQDLRPEAKRIIFDYMNTYREYARTRVQNRPATKSKEGTMMPTSNGPFCQSCGMPMEKPEHFGTETDKSPNKEYCTYCYQNGAFTVPSMTYEQMLAFDVNYFTTELKMPEAKAREFVLQFLPNLKRWKK